MTGVSGSGKSTLVNDILYPVLAQRAHRGKGPAGKHDGVDGLDLIDKVIRIDQSPIGRTPRSNPATYTQTLTPIRTFFAELPESRARGYKPGRFSFNVKGGRCEACRGDGNKRIEMSFLPDVFVRCDVCRGRRYNQETLQVKYKGYSIADLLEATVEEALPLLENFPAIHPKLKTLDDVGLGYIHLGQSSTTLSGARRSASSWPASSVNGRPARRFTSSTSRPPASISTTCKSCLRCSTGWPIWAIR